MLRPLQSELSCVGTPGAQQYQSIQAITFHAFEAITPKIDVQYLSNRLTRFRHEHHLLRW